MDFLIFVSSESWFYGRLASHYLHDVRRGAIKMAIPTKCNAKSKRSRESHMRTTHRIPLCARSDTTQFPENLTHTRADILNNDQRARQWKNERKKITEQSSRIAADVHENQING